MKFRGISGRNWLMGLASGLDHRGIEVLHDEALARGCVLAHEELEGLVHDAYGGKIHGGQGHARADEALELAGADLSQALEARDLRALEALHRPIALLLGVAVRGLRFVPDTEERRFQY